MEKLSREQILDMLARAEAELLRIRISQQPQLLRKPLGLMRQADNACRDVLPRQIYVAKCQQFLVSLSQALEQTINQDDRKNLKEITELAADILNQLYTNLKDEPALARLARQKKEIVFLPYKAAMWDSLESIWQAAVDDSEHCRCYVVPIPYADRNPDGTAKEWHNERNLFPSYVPTLDCDTFDLEALHPDVIFIHNPYDACNRVTSVDSRFYSNKLKKYTDKLVYVPYFVTGKSIRAHFCQAPGVVNADYVIVENEKIKKIYEENYPGGDPPEGKFLALGSPKYDKVILSKKESYPLPEEWSRLIAGRKIILYNTSLQPHLMYADKIVDKLKSVLTYFKGRQDLAFWWRPHPLMEATLDSMIPQVAAGYRALRDEFLREGWGIYDNTSEMERAIVWSDAYYGDRSSMVELYEKTGKPLMIQNMEVYN